MIAILYRTIREGTRILNFMTNLEVKLDQDTIYRVLASARWGSQDSLLPTDPRIITGTRQALADGLFFPCPEIPPDPQDDAWDKEDADAADRAQTSHLETRNPELETPHTLMASENRKLGTENLPLNERENSAKNLL